MAEYFPDIECLTSEELLSIVLSIVAPDEADSRQEFGLRFDAQRAATELYCRARPAARSARTGARTGAVSRAVGTVSPLSRG